MYSDEDDNESGATFTVYEDDFKDAPGAKLTLSAVVTQKTSGVDTLSGQTECALLTGLELDYDLTPFTDPRGRLKLENKHGAFDETCSRAHLYGPSECNLEAGSTDTYECRNPY